MVVIHWIIPRHFKFLLWFYAYKCLPECMYLYHTCSRGQWRSKEDIRSFEMKSHRFCKLQVLGTELGSSMRAACALNGWATSPESFLYIFTWWVSSGINVVKVELCNRPKSLFLPVCKEFLNRFYNSLLTRGIDFSVDAIEEELISFCVDTKGKENRLVW